MQFELTTLGETLPEQERTLMYAMHERYSSLPEKQREDEESILNSFSRFTLLGTGASKVVYALSEKVVAKIEARPWSMSNTQTHTEWDLWNKTLEKEHINQFLCPILGRSWLAPFGHTRIVYAQRADTLYGQKNVSGRFLEQLDKVFIQRWNCPHFLVADLKADNLGLHDGRIVLIDYGFI